MAKQGLLAQLKPSANTDTVLYSAPIDSTASTVLTIANDGTGSAYDVALKNYDQKFTLDAATYKLHEGDLITSSVVEVGTPISATAPLLVGNTITTTDQEKSFKFESAMEELEKIVAQLEEENSSLEKSLELYEKGVKIAEKLRKHLDDAEQRIEVLKKNKNSSSDVEDPIN